MKAIICSKQYFVLLLFLAIIMAACENDSEPDKEQDPNNNNILKDTVDLIQSDEYGIFMKYVFIYEDSAYLITSPLNYFIGGLEDFIAITNYDNYLTTVNTILSDAENRDSLNAGDYFEERRMEYLLAHFLEKGNCHIKDKETNSSVLYILLEDWNDEYNLTGGRRFYIKGELFLETIDWLSMK